MDCIGSNQDVVIESMWNFPSEMVQLDFSVDLEPGELPSKVVEATLYQVFVLFFKTVTKEHFFSTIFYL